MVSGLVTSPHDHQARCPGAPGARVPWIARAADLLGGRDTDADEVEARALRLATAAKIDHGTPPTHRRLGGAESNLQSQGLEFLHQHVEGLRDAGLRQVLPLHDRLVHAAAAVHVVRLDGQDLLQRVRGAVRLQRPHFHFAEPLAAELRLAGERLLRDQRVRPDGPRVDLVVDQVRQLEHVDRADRDRRRRTAAPVRPSRSRTLPAGVSPAARSSSSAAASRPRPSTASSSAASAVRPTAASASAERRAFAALCSSSLTRLRRPRAA